MNDAYNYEGFRNACSSGNLELVKYLYDKKMNNEYYYKGFYNACSSGNLNLVKYLCE